MVKIENSNVQAGQLSSLKNNLVELTARKSEVESTQLLKKSNGLSLSEMSHAIKAAIDGSVTINTNVDSSRANVGFAEQTAQYPEYGVTKESIANADFDDQTAQSLGHGVRSVDDIKTLEAEQTAQSLGYRAAHYLGFQARIESSDEQNRLDSCLSDAEIDKVDQAIEEKIFLHRQLANN